MGVGVFVCLAAAAYAMPQVDITIGESDAVMKSETSPVLIAIEAVEESPMMEEGMVEVMDGKKKKRKGAKKDDIEVKGNKKNKKNKEEKKKAAKKQRKQQRKDNKQ